MEPRVKFAVVREDPRLELAIAEKIGARSVLVVASGGCTALTLQALRPELEVCAFDLAPLQLEHVLAKREAAIRGDLTALNTGGGGPEGLNQRGEFESLFRVLTTTVRELVGSEAELAAFFESDAAARREALARWTASRYWPAAFATAFNEPLLHAMFGPAATQHAEPGSYPGYFQRAFERGLTRPDAAKNPFLQHVFLGTYLPEDAPEYITRGAALKNTHLELVQGSLPDVPRLERFDLLSLSNVFDWSDAQQIATWADTLAARAKPGSAILIRQLNNQRDLTPWLTPHYRFDPALALELLRSDRSLFYEKLEVGFRV